MTRDEMLAEIDALRSKGHTIGITGSGREWHCEMDGKLYGGATPMAAFEAGRDAVMPNGVKP